MDEFLAFEKAILRSPDGQSFETLDWVWRHGERWAVLGPDNSRKGLIAQALLGIIPLASGEMRGPTRVTVVSPQTQRHVATQEASFYQSRWHSGIAEGQRTVSDFLSQLNVEERNPFEVGLPNPRNRQFAKRRRKFLRLLHIEHLLRRKLVHLSNGELRKTLIVQALLKEPQLLILEDPFAGLDPVSRTILRRVIARLSRSDRPVLAITSRPDEVPPSTSHVLLIDKGRVVAQGRKSEALREWRRRSGSPRAWRSTPIISPAPRAQTPLVELKKVSIVAGSGRAILDEISWSVNAADCWAVLGPNGSGKTTLLNLVQGDHPQFFAQEIRLFGRAATSTDTLWRARQRMSWMSPELHQHYPPGLTLIEVVCSGFFSSLGLFETPSAVQRSRALRCLKELELGNHANTTFDEVPFGEQRLVLLARAMVKSPRLLLLDEPAQGLDAAQRGFLLTAVDRFVRRTRPGLIFVTHHPREIPACITHRLRLRKGRIIESTPCNASKGQQFNPTAVIQF